MFSTNLIVAYSYPHYGISNIKNEIPWNLKNELNYFKNITSNIPIDNSNKDLNYINAVVMGRKTWDSINRRILPNRINVVITNNNNLIEEYEYINSNLILTSWDNYEKEIGNYLININSKSDFPKLLLNEIFIIGGSEIYNLALNTKTISKILITEVYINNCINNYSSFYPIKLQTDKYKLVEISNFQEENNIYYRYLEYNNIEKINNCKEWINNEEQNYLDLMQHILVNGIKREDRTGTGTLSSFGHQLRFNLRDHFPITTTKSSFLRGVFEELMLYLSGKTDNKILQDKKIHIWDGNTSRDFLDKRGLFNYPEGDMGETYGFNMRHFGGEYINCKTNYPLDGSNGFDQLNNIIHLLKNDPTSRRIIINLWNPATQNRASLPSCLCQYQFWVNTTTNELHLQIYIRSSDYFLANNWNTCTGALFVHMLCNTKGLEHLKPGELIVTTGDTHIYLNHIEQVEENLKRKPFPFPKLIIKNGLKNNITDFEWTDFQLLGYKNHPKIEANMAV